MKTSEAKKLVGKEIEWMEHVCPLRGGIVRRGILAEVRGKNALVYSGGCNDWKWLPQMIGLRLRENITSDGKAVA